VQKLTGIQAVCFDVGNTLLTTARDEAAVFTEQAALLGVVLDHAQVQKLFVRMYDYYEQLYEQDDSFWADKERAVSIWITMYTYLCGLLEVPAAVTPALARAVYAYYLQADSWAPFADVLPTIDALRARGLKLALISNWDVSLSNVIMGLGLAEYFQAIVSSAVVGMHKPQAQIFAYTCQQLGVPAAATVHVGDHLEADAGGAAAAGLTPVLIDRSRHLAGQTPPHLLVIDDLRQLLDLL